MKRKYFSNQQAYWYFLLTCIILVGILAFYLSCKSKSPTEANAPSDAMLTAQAGKNPNQTTTTSSTTTTIQPKQSPTTTSLITSRTLTTTSTRITTTSTSTSTSIPITTTSIGYPILEWCCVTVNGKPIGNKGFLNLNHLTFNSEQVIAVFIKNIGTASANQVTATLKIKESPYGSGLYAFTAVDNYEYLGTIPADKKCYGSSSAFKIYINPVACCDYCRVVIKIKVPGCKNCTIYCRFDIEVD